MGKIRFILAVILDTNPRLCLCQRSFPQRQMIRDL